MIHQNDAMAMRRDVLGQLMLLAKLLNADMERSLGPAELTMARAHVLWEIGADPGMTQRMLAEKLEVTPRNVTALIDALEASSLVLRKAHPTDRRATQLALTEKGADFYRRFLEGRDQFAKLLFGDVGSARLGQLRTELGEIVAKLEALAQSPAAGVSGFE